MVCICKYWSKLYILMSIGRYLTVFVCTGTYWLSTGVLSYWWVLVGTWLYLCVPVRTDFVLVCFAMYCKYKTCLYGFVSVSQYFMHWPALPKQYVQLAHIDSIFMYLLVLMCVLVYLYVACISVYRVNWPVAPTVCILLWLLVLTWRYLHILVCLMCIDLYCTLWYVFI